LAGSIRVVWILFVVGWPGLAFAQTLTFTDDPLVPGATLVRAVHLEELRTAVSALRARLGLPSVMFTDHVLTPGTAQIRGIHILQLRSALDAVFDLRGRVRPTYTDPALAPGVTVVKALHITELRNAIRTADPASPLQLTGGTLSVGDVIVATVTLTEPAPSGGLPIQLTIGAPALARVQPTVVVPAGEREGRFTIEGLAAGTTTASASIAGLPPAAAAIAVLARDFDVSDLRVVNVGMSATATIHLRSAAPLGGAAIQLTSADPSRLAVPAVVNIAPGQTRATFDVTGLQEGLVAVTATAAVGAVGSRKGFVSVAAAATDPAMTTEQLIEQARRAGTLSDELAFVYRVYAAFGAPALPAAYRGRAAALIDSPVRLEINARWDSLSPSARSAILPYTIPPVYAGSWGDSGGSGASTQQAPGSLASASDVRVEDASGPHPCEILPLPGLLPGWGRFVTTHFYIWFRTANPRWGTLAEAQAAAGNVAAVAEEVYASLTAVMDRHPLPDGGVGCNGGDAKLDVYIDRLKMGNKAEVNAYPGGCEQGPSWMWIAPDDVLDARDARAMFAHEFMHMIQFTYGRHSACTEYAWMDEATANWAIEHVYHDRVDNWEHRYIYGYLTEPNSQGDGELTEINVPLDAGLWSPRSRLCPGGYCDYPFFLYIAKRFGEHRIRQIHQASEAMDPIDSIAAGVAGSLRDVWHDFSLAMYNDVHEGIANQFFEWDAVEDGIRATTFDDRWDVLAVREMTLAGRAERAQNLNSDIAGTFSCRRAGCPGNFPLYRLSIRPISLKFTDDAVSYAVLYNPYGAIPSPNVKIWALQRINGEWKSPEDWTTRTSKTYCRDRREERIEELVLIYANGDTTSRGQTGEWYVELDANTDDDAFGLLPQVALSNAGCWKWRGSATLTTLLPQELVRTESARDVVMERRRPPQAPDGAPTTEGFFVTSAVVTLEQSGIVNPVCTMQLGPASAAITEQQYGGLGGFSLRMAHIDPTSDEEFEFDRRAIGSGVGFVTATATLTCEGQGPLVSTQLHPMTWMVTPLEGIRLSTDGHRLSGTFTLTPFQTLVLDFVAEKE
jgi:hypothetical protein